jgi:hypothetical protein
MTGPDANKNENNTITKYGHDSKIDPIDIELKE